MIPYDFSQEAIICTNELYYRYGSMPRDISRLESEYVKETIERYLQEAFNAGKQANAS